MKVNLLRKDKQDEVINTLTVNQYLKIANKYKYGTVRGKRNKFYIKEECYIDTETSHITLENDEVQWIYQWAFLFGKFCIVGRDIEELMLLLVELKQIYQLDENKRLLIYVHNLSYDWSSMESFLTEIFQEDGLLTDCHKPLYMLYEGIEFRCSYRLTGLSLSKLAKDYGSTYIKADGYVDYSIVRYSDTKLTNKDWTYMLNDVYALRDGVRGYTNAMKRKNVFWNEYTATGFVRDDARKNARACKGWHRDFYNTKLDIDQYKMCKQAFAGGYTHGNRYHTEDTIIGNIKHRDFTSSYPARQIMNYFPIGKGGVYGVCDDLEELKEICSTDCCIFNLYLKNPRLKRNVTMPYIGISKCNNINVKNALHDNGRLLLYNGVIETTVTELDFDIILRQYEYDNIGWSTVYNWKRGYLPQWFRGTVMSYYKGKTELKNVPSREMDYGIAKSRLNSIYGMTATDPIRRKVYRDGNDWIKDCVHNNDVTLEEELQKYYDKHSSFMPYQFSVWTTAHARYELFKCIELIGYENVLYCDTDSAFYISNEEIEKKIEEYNNNIIELAKDTGAFATDIKGKTHYLGTFEDEKDDITEFRYLHAKCYAMITKGKLKCTIAGVTAYKDLQVKDDIVRYTREEELQNINNLTNNFIFTKCGGTQIKYVQHPNTTTYINGHKVIYGNAGIIHNVTKELSNLPQIDQETGLPMYTRLLF